MPQKFAFTTAAMAAALEETAVSYEDLADIERDFDDAETDISEFYLIFACSRASLRPPPELNPSRTIQTYINCESYIC